MPDFVERADNAFKIQAGAFVDFCVANPGLTNLTAGEIAELQGLKTGWESDLWNHHEARNAARTARVQKDESRGNYEGAFRKYAARIQVNPAITDADRAFMQITVPDRV